ncbi:MAG: ribosome maturation factor RimM [Frankiales bacterium]|nr:ribosome maturation factor RimM [Frankiales bacterium]
MLVVVGRIGRPHGIRGEVTVEVRTDSPETRFAPGSVLVTEPARLGPLTVAAARWHSGRLLLSVAGVRDRTGAEALRGAVLSADVADDEVPEDPEEFFDHQLRGLRVVGVDGAPIGTVGDVVHLPGQDLLSVVREDGREVLVPFVAELVPDIDVEAGVVTVAPPPGLLELDEPDGSDEPGAPAGPSAGAGG